MTYSLDFRNHILKVKSEEGLTYKQTAERFKIGIASLTRWNKRISPKSKRDRGAVKLNMDALKEDILLHPDSYQYERAARLQVSQACIFHALKRLGVSYKKNTDTPQSRRKKTLIVSEKDW